MRVLALGCSHEVLARLRADRRISEIVVAEHYPGKAGGGEASVGDPVRFDLMIHDCGSGEVFPHQVGNEYLHDVLRHGEAVSLDLVVGQAEGAGHLSLVGAQRQTGFRVPTPRITSHPKAIHAQRFLDECGGILGDRVLYWPFQGAGDFDTEFEELVINQEGEPLVVGSSPDLRILGLPRPKDDSHVGQMIYSFVTNAILNINPRLLHGLYTSTALQELLLQRERVIDENRQRVVQIDERIKEESEFLATHAPLGVLRDEALKERVALTLEEVFGFEVIDLDTLYPEAKTGDLYVSSERLMIEVRSGGRRNARVEDIENAVSNARRTADRGKEVERIALIFNGQLDRATADRDPPFSERVSEEAVSYGVSLLSGGALLARVLAMRSGEWTARRLMTEFSTGGPAGQVEADHRIVEQ